jgi:hypothetical protein
MCVWFVSHAAASVLLQVELSFFVPLIMGELATAEETLHTGAA